MTDVGYASLCFLSYNRPAFIGDAITSAVENAGYPCEVIVHDDGSSDPVVRATLTTLLDQGKISHLILNPAGHNEGVGTATKRMFDLATGDPIIKLDQDLLFEPDWLARVVGIHKLDAVIGMLGLFKYHHEPVIWREKKLDTPTPAGYHYTSQFCGSAMSIPFRVWDRHQYAFGEHSDAFCEDSEFMAYLRQQGLELALTDDDLVTNRGFGIGPSTVVEEGYVVHKIHHEPHIIGRPVASELVLPATANAPVEATDERMVENAYMAHFEETTVNIPALALLGEDHSSFEYDWTLPPEVMAGIEIPRDHRRFDVGVVITTCAGREENLNRVLDNVGRLEGCRPNVVVVVYDGCEPPDDRIYAGDIPIWRIKIDKHEPGLEQPRNVGARELHKILSECNYVWFLDSDMVFPSDTLQHFYRGLCAADEDRILIGPYDWMAPGAVIPHGQVLMADYRWASFTEHGPEVVHRHDLGTGLACFSGNLIWPLKEFLKIGGYHIELHHGRCEDGELGLRACEAGVPMSLVRDARAWHVWHPIDTPSVLAKNERDVPLLNAMHPWVETEGLRVVDKDGKRFDWKCPNCDGIFNTLDFWPHAASHRNERAA